MIEELEAARGARASRWYTGGGATVAHNIVVDVRGIRPPPAAPLKFILSIPTGPNTPVAPLIVNFTPPLPAHGQHVPIQVWVPLFGMGNTDAAVVAYGQQMPAVVVG